MIKSTSESKTRPSCAASDEEICERACDDKESLASINPVAKIRESTGSNKANLTPANPTEAACESTGINKANLSPTKCFILAMLAGMFIGFGATFFLTFTADPTLSFGVKKLAGGLCFCLGLVLVLCCGAELFTGNALMVMSLASKKITLQDLAKNWCIVLVGNLVGSLFLVLLVSVANIAQIDAGGATIGENMANVAANKINLEWTQIFVRGILCNMLVCLAVWIGFSAKTVAEKVLGIILPIAGFVASGYEHCVANMFFLPMGMVADPTKVDVVGILYNLSASIPGNIVGGVVLVGLAYWYVYHETGADTD